LLKPNTNEFQLVAIAPGATILVKAILVNPLPLPTPVPFTTKLVTVTVAIPAILSPPSIKTPLLAICLLLEYLGMALLVTVFGPEITPAKIVIDVTQNKKPIIIHNFLFLIYIYYLLFYVFTIFYDHPKVATPVYLLY
jgi:hypothetical protein